MRWAFAAVLVSILFLCACGYVGPVLPPSPEIPNAVTNLSAVQRGDQIVINFTTPARTTDSLAIREFEDIDLKIGESDAPFNINAWAASAKPYEVGLPPASERDDPQPKPISLTVPVTGWEGKHVAVLVRTSVKKKEHFSRWSNRVVLDIVPPLNPPVVHVESTAKGISVSWETRPGESYEVFRQGPSDKTPTDLGSTNDGFFIDGAALYDTEYRYTVVAKIGAAESLPSKVQTLTARDTFAPEVPASITALSGPSTVEVSWQRSPDSDLRGYYVYRATNNGPYERQGSLVNVPTYTDSKVEHGKTYRYAVSAVDQKGNESAKSSATEVTF